MGHQTGTVPANTGNLCELMGKIRWLYPFLFPMPCYWVRKHPDAGKDWRQEEKGVTEYEMVGWHHQLDGHEFEQAPEDGEGQGSLAYCSPWNWKELDVIEGLNNNNLKECQFLHLSKKGSLLGKVAAAAAKSLQSCPTLCDPIDGSPPGSTVPGILQARTLEWVAISFSNAWKWKVKVKSLSRVRLLGTPWTAAHQAPPSMGFSRQEYWSGVPSPRLLK